MNDILVPGMDAGEWMAARLEKALSAVVCPDCGGHHQLSISVSKRNIRPASGRVFSVSVGSGACEGFRRRVKALAMIHISAPDLLELHFQ